MRARRHLQHVVAGTALALTGVLFAQTSPSNVAVTAIRFWTLNEVTRVAVETTGDFEFRSDRIDNPERVFFDLLGTKSQVGKKGMKSIPVNDRLLKQIRVAEPHSGVTRVVFDLEAGVQFSASQLSNPSRLIIELRPGPGRPDRLAAARDVSAPRQSAEPELEALPKSSPQPPVLKQPPRLEAAVPPTASPAITEAAAVAPPLPKKSVKVDTLPEPTHAKERVLASTSAPRAAKLPRNGDRSLTRVLGLKVGRIVLDAGHGGHDTGTNGPNGLLEKDLVLDVAKRLGAMIESRLGSQVIYTRSDDTFVPLELRTQIANEQKADLFLSIHANSSPARNSSGVETYYLNFTTSKSALEVAARENASSQKTVYELKDLLQKIALKDKVEESREFAARVQTALFTFSAKSNPKAKDRGVKKAPFVVLIGAQMPSVLAEIGFVSNPKDEGLMKRGEHRQKMAEALFKGLSQYAATLSHFQVAKN
ncbi:MAG TPA: N-acetylmuramoyl-L-alanine amidase [Bryobacteraceae bacterium]|nr:N-acetylmuramoyl-L-alanine amidase [Bryobacteraceae bacterium]